MKAIFLILPSTSHSAIPTPNLTYSFGRYYPYAQIKKSLRESLKPQRAEIKQTEDVLKKLLTSGVTTDEILEKLK